MKHLVIPALGATLLALAACAGDDDTSEGPLGVAGEGSGAESPAEAPPPAGIAPVGLAEIESASSVEETIAAVEGAIAGNGALRRVAIVDHEANAASIGETLRPTRLILFGNPNLGTPLMQANRLAGLDLPQKMLAWQDADGVTRLDYNVPAYLAARHGLEGVDAQLDTIGGALATIASNATGATVDPASFDGADVADVTSGEGVVTVAGTRSFEDTWAALRGAVEAAEPLSIVAEVDHAANAASVGLQLPPTRLLIFGNPALGTPLMRSRRTVGIDLPQKLLVAEDDEGAVSISYDDPAYVAARHGIVDRDGTIETIAGALAGLAADAAGDGTDADAPAR